MSLRLWQSLLAFRMAGLTERNKIIQLICGKVVTAEVTTCSYVVNIKKWSVLVMTTILASVVIPLASLPRLFIPIRPVIRLNTPLKLRIHFGVFTNMGIPTFRRAEPQSGILPLARPLKILSALFARAYIRAAMFIVWFAYSCSRKCCAMLSRLRTSLLYLPDLCQIALLRAVNPRTRPSGIEDYAASQTGLSNDSAIMSTRGALPRAKSAKASLHGQSADFVGCVANLAFARCSFSTTRDATERLLSNSRFKARSTDVSVYLHPTGCAMRIYDRHMAIIPTLLEP